MGWSPKKRALLGGVYTRAPDFDFQAERVRSFCLREQQRNEKNPFGVSALRQACVTGSLHAISALLEHADNLDTWHLLTAVCNLDV